MINRQTLVHWLDSTLCTSSFKDASLNGLQVEGAAEVRTIGVAVDASLATFKQAQQAKVDFLITHHGLFWGQVLPVVGGFKAKLHTLFEADISLYTSHIPLDAHPELGNNARLAQLLGLQVVSPFVDPKYGNLGVIAETNPLEVSALISKLEQLYQPYQQHPNDRIVGLAFGGSVRRVAVVSGDAINRLDLAQAQGCDTLITGETSHPSYHQALEVGMNVICAGHYMTEIWGVLALAERIKQEFGLEYTFLQHPTGI